MYTTHYAKYWVIEQNRTEFIAQTMHNTRYGALANACIQTHTHTHTHTHI